MPSELREQLLQIGLTRFDGYFAGGQPANNKLNLDGDMLNNHPAIREAVVESLADLTEPYDPEFVAGVPRGATLLAGWVAYELSVRKDKNVYIVELAKDSDGMRYANEVEENTARCLERGVLIEDVFNIGSSTLQALQVDGLAEKVQLVATVFDRGKPSWRKHNHVEQPVLHVVGRPIRPKLWRYSRLWRYVS